MTIFEKLEAGHYTTKYPYPSAETMPPELNEAVARAEAALADAKKARASWQAEAKRIRNEDAARLLFAFRADLEEEHDMAGHPKAGALWSKAYDEGHASGLYEIALRYASLAELLQSFTT